MIDKIFDGCVNLLVWLAEKLGTTYKAVNVWIFVRDRAADHPRVRRA